MKLCGDKVRVIGEFDNLDEAFFFGNGSDDQASFFELLSVGGIKFVTMAVSFMDGVGFPIEGMGLRVWFKSGFTRAKSHGPPQVGDSFLFFLKANDGVGALRGELSGAGAFEPADIAGEFDGGDLHTEANAKIGDLILPGISCSADFSFDAPVPESSGNENTIKAGEELFILIILEIFSVDPEDIDPCPVRCSGDCEGLIDGFVSILEFDIFSDHSDGDVGGGIDDAVDKILPGAQVRSFRAEAQSIGDQAVDLIFPEIKRAFVDGVLDIAESDHVTGRDIAEHCDLGLVVLIEVMLGAADDNVGLNSDLTELGDGLLRGFRLNFSCCTDERKEGDVDKADIFPADFERELSKGFKKEMAFNVADRSANFGDDDIDIGVFLGGLIQAILDFIGDVGDELDSFAEVVTAAFLSDDIFKDLTGAEGVDL